MKEQMEPYYTSDFGLATWLRTNGFELIGAVKKRDTQRVFIVFKDRDDRGSLELRWEEYKAYGETHTFDKTTKEIRNAIKDASVVEELV